MEPAPFIFLNVLIIGVIICTFFGIHKVEEGHVGIYYKYGKLQQEQAQPGYNFLNPLVTRASQVQISVQTDAVTSIPCGTSGGTLINFDKIEVVNRLKKEYVYQTIKNYTENYDQIWIYDKIQHEINKFCSQHTLHEILIENFDSLDEELMAALQQNILDWAPGIELISIRVTKPIIPRSLNEAFEQLEKIKSQIFVLQEEYYVKEQQLKNQETQKLIEQKSQIETEQINLKKNLYEKQKEVNLKNIENEMYLNKVKMEAKSEYEKILADIELNEGKLTNQYLLNQFLHNCLEHLTIHSGEKIPTYLNSNTQSV